MRRYIFTGLLLLSTQSIADPLGDFFTSMGNTVATSPGYFQGQTLNTFVGGSVSYRVPQKTYQLASLSPPSITAGCGGIDAYASAFSFINSDQLVQMLQNIGNNSTGAVFKLAIDSVSPQLGGVMDYMNDLAQKVNALNINSCEAATGIVQAATGDANNKSTNNYLSNFGSQVSGIGSDLWDAKSKISQNIAYRKSALQQAKSSSDGVADKLKDVNVTWEALKTIKNSTGTQLSDEQMRFLMTMFGTTICSSQGDDPNNPSSRSCMYYPPQPNINDRLIVSGGVRLMGNSCARNAALTDDHDCLYPSYATLSPDFYQFTVNGKQYSTFSDYIKAQMDLLKDAIYSRSTVDQNSTQIKQAYGLISMSSVPAWILIKLAAMDPTSNAFYERAVQSIATDAAYNYISDAAQAVRIGIEHEKKDSKYMSSQSDMDALNDQAKSLNKILESLGKARANNEQKLSQLGTISSSIRLLSASLESRMTNVRNTSGN